MNRYQVRFDFRGASILVELWGLSALEVARNAKKLASKVGAKAEAIRCYGRIGSQEVWEDVSEIVLDGFAVMDSYKPGSEDIPTGPN